MENTYLKVLGNVIFQSSLSDQYNVNEKQFFF